MTSFRPYLNPHTKRWQAIVELGRDEAGKRKQIFRTVAKQRNTRAEAKRVGRLLLNELEAASALEPSDMSVAALLEGWLADVARHTVTPRTYARYRGIVELHLIPALGQLPLSELQPLRIQELWARQLEAGLDPATVAKHHTVQRAALSHRVRMRL